MFQELRASLVLLVFFTLLTGIAYPLATTAIGETLFPHQAGGSLSVKNGAIIGSELIGQSFTSDRYFQPRPSAAGNGYDANNSSGSNLAPTSPDLVATIAARVAEWRKNGDTRPIPADLVTASGSGLDPDISVASALYQIPRIAAARNLTSAQVQALITQHVTPPDLGILGENRVNVLALNRALDEIAPMPPPAPPAPAEPAPEPTPAPMPENAAPAGATPPAAAPAAP